MHPPTVHDGAQRSARQSHEPLALGWHCGKSVGRLVAGEASLPDDEVDEDEDVDEDVDEVVPLDDVLPELDVEDELDVALPLSRWRSDQPEKIEQALTKRAPVSISHGVRWGELIDRTQQA